MEDIATVCTKARDLILRDGFTTGGHGWHGLGGWCIEGALGAALGLDCLDTHLSEKVNASPAGQAIRTHLGMGYAGSQLHSWNDGYGSTEGVLRVLAEVAAKYTEGPTIEVEVAYEPPVLMTMAGPVTLAVKVLPPMPETTKKVGWFKALVGV